MNFWDQLDSKYRLILCDVWGVVHDGVQLYPGAVERLLEWRSAGRQVLLLTNAPRSEEAVRRQLDGIGLPRDCYDGIVSSGEAGITALNALGEPVGFIGTAGDRRVLEDRGVRVVDNGDFREFACTGLRKDGRDPQSYLGELESVAARNARMHCLNPDRVVVRGGEQEACAGALADIYESLGGEVVWYGKPYAPIYAHALTRGGNPPLDTVLAVGDGLQTDMLGAARMGIDAVFVTGGIHRGEGFPENFAAARGLDDWRPVGVVDSLT